MTTTPDGTRRIRGAYPPPVAIAAAFHTVGVARATLPAVPARARVIVK